MASIFISHSTADKPFVRQLSQDLKQVGHSVWLDEEQIQVGASIAEQCFAAGESVQETIDKIMHMINDEDDDTFITDKDNDPRVDQIIDGTLEIEDIEVVLE